MATGGLRSYLTSTSKRRSWSTVGLAGVGCLGGAAAVHGIDAQSRSTNSVACELPPGAVQLGDTATGSVVDTKGPDFGENRWAGAAFRDRNGQWVVILAQHRQTGLGVEATMLNGLPLKSPKIAQPKGSPGIICYTYNLSNQELKEGIMVSPASSCRTPGRPGDPTSITSVGAPQTPASLRRAVETGGGKVVRC